MEFYKYSDGVLPNTLALSYVVLGYPLAIALLPTAWWLLAVLLLAHTLIIAAYLLHECAHNTIFKSNRLNHLAGTFLAWLTGACYSPYRTLKQKHMRHHIERADVLVVDSQQLLQQHPRLSRWLELLAYLHLPAKELLTHAIAIAAPFFVHEMRALRWRTAAVLFIRSLLFVVLALWSFAALLGYMLAYLLFISVLGFMDAFQHNYELEFRAALDNQKPKQNADYEETHTFSNLLSQNHPWLNLLVLNFCYHNVHHQKPSEPWYRLSRLHRQRYGNHCQQMVALDEQWRRYHRYRLQRFQGNGDPEQVGAAGVSFLVGV